MRRHIREKNVTEAEAALRDAVLDLRSRFNLTEGRTKLRVVSGVLGTWLARCASRWIRDERHSNAVKGRWER